MNVLKEQMHVPRYALTPPPATHVHATLAIVWQVMDVLAMVGANRLCNY